MNDLNTEQIGGDNEENRHISQLEQTYQQLLQQVADCRQELDLVQSALQQAQDVVARHRHVEAEQSKLLVRERELNELKSNFITLASHEFRTPMMTILSSASLISRYSAPEEGANRERHIQRIKAAVNSLTSMLNDFLSISQIDQNAVGSNALPMEITALCQEAITSVETMAKPRQLFHYLPQTGPLWLNLDGQLLKNILINLLINASRYSAEDTDIQLVSATQHNHAIFTVSDQGIGIPDADKDKLFSHFFRARNAVPIQGTGLGLYLAKRYAELMGGSITFTSQVGQGTTFTVQLPLTN
ncbi:MULTISPECIES: sensor histidine kinase [Spirosoma]|uniref:histidine kinase n=1 Tax=Spirosoma liriopis TaxID=2937440 RepID=A0ABT0HTV7_9BACT|nr:MULTISPECIES: HAMP domain-containing sensor histidine kinase [Spirosoma]MCK8495594.1 HAMP domain-containing histidine kinase [Spirosoma liriopis]UHG94621.1 HAMP domain-containing histidine kinase [Spirosoma oryzicola]